MEDKGISLHKYIAFVLVLSILIGVIAYIYGGIAIAITATIATIVCAIILVFICKK